MTNFKKFCYLNSLELIRVSNSMASPYKSLKVWVKHFFGYLVYEIFLWPESWRGSLFMYLLSFPRFWTIYWKALILSLMSPLSGYIPLLQFDTLIKVSSSSSCILNGVTLKNSNILDSTHWFSLLYRGWNPSVKSCCTDLCRCSCKS